jgi:hypothetical protein
MGTFMVSENIPSSLAVFKCVCSWPYRALTVITNVDTPIERRKNIWPALE